MARLHHPQPMEGRAGWSATGLEHQPNPVKVNRSTRLSSSSLEILLPDNVIGSIALSESVRLGPNPSQATSLYSSDTSTRF